MKKIIGNLLYDTEKAEKIYSFMQKRIDPDKYIELGFNDFENA